MSERTGATALRDAVERLAQAGIPGAARDARILLADVLGCDAGGLAATLERQLTARQLERFTKYISSRCQRQPVAQILGRREFWGTMFRVTPDVLDPRPESETIVELALENSAPKRILDLGTGTGCLAISLLREVPGATALATDKSRQALSVARVNARQAGVADRLEFLQANWFEGVAGRFDLVVCNPPYVSAREYAGLAADVRDWEPKEALTPGGDGLAAYRILAAGLSEHLAEGGKAFFEIGHRQAAPVCAIFDEAGFAAICVHKDLGGRDRVVEVGQSCTIYG